MARNVNKLSRVTLLGNQRTKYEKDYTSELVKNQ